MLIKIENYILNTVHIVAIEHSEDQVSVWLSETDRIKFTEKSAKALLEFFSDPDRVTDLAPLCDEVADFQAYQDRGGTMIFDDFTAAFRQHDRLCAIEKPTQRDLVKMSELEHKLLY